MGLRCFSELSFKVHSLLFPYVYVVFMFIRFDQKTIHDSNFRRPKLKFSPPMICICFSWKPEDATSLGWLQPLKRSNLDGVSLRLWADYSELRYFALSNRGVPIYSPLASGCATSCILYFHRCQYLLLTLENSFPSGESRNTLQSIFYSRSRCIVERTFECLDSHRQRSRFSKFWYDNLCLLNKKFVFMFLLYLRGFLSSLVLFHFFVCVFCIFFLPLVYGIDFVLCFYFIPTPPSHSYPLTCNFLKMCTLYFYYLSDYH